MINVLHNIYKLKKLILNDLRLRISSQNRSKQFIINTKSIYLMIFSFYLIKPVVHLAQIKFIHSENHILYPI